MRLLLLLAALFVCGPSLALTYTHGGSTEGCRDPVACHAWINAKGEIDGKSLDDLKRYIADNPYAPRVIRFESPGGNLVEGVELGFWLRENGYKTEATLCASACLYAFLGGTKRTGVGTTPMLGIHRFYSTAGAREPDPSSITSLDMDGTQRIMGALLQYAVYMGVDLRLLAYTIEAGPEEMRWLTMKEAVDLKVVFEPNRWLPWEVVGGEDGGSPWIISRTQDGTKSMQLSCSNGRRSFSFADTLGNPKWFRQCREGPTNGHHIVLGVAVPTASVEVVDLKGGGAFLNFNLPSGPLNYNDVSVFSWDDDYSMACTDTDGDYEGTTVRLAALARYALIQCR